MIHVCFGLYDKTGRYSKFTGTAILSLFENTKSEVTVHIIHGSTVSADNRDKFTQLAERYNQRVKLYNVEELCADKVTEMKNLLTNTFKAQYSLAAIYRFFIPELFSPDIEKVIYLDSDIIVNLDIAELWKIELNDAPLGVIPTISQNLGKDWMHWNFPMCRNKVTAFEDYFNSGVLFINLKIFRHEEKNIIDGFKFVASHSEYTFFDQDVLNYCFATRALKLPNKFNRYVISARSEKVSPAQSIYHYVGQNITWSFGLDMDDPFNRLWMNYFIKTPWFDAESIGRLYKGVQKLHVDLKQAMIQLSALMSGKARAFFALPEDIEMLKIFFSIQGNEEVILAEGQHSLQELIYAMRRSHGKKVFFIIVANFPFNVLTEAGFVNGRDFLNGIEFFSEANGMPLDSHTFLKSM